MIYWYFRCLHFYYTYRKKLRAEIGNQYPGIPAEQLRDVVPNKEEMSVMKLYSHAGHNVIVYILIKTPIFFELEKEIFPTGKMC